jgi:hypothetical protein
MMKKFQDFMQTLANHRNEFERYFSEEITNVSGGLAAQPAGSFSGISGYEKPLKRKIFRRGHRELKKYEGKVFMVPSEEFKKLKDGKIRGERWNRYIDEDSDLGVQIKNYSLRNPSRPVVVKNEETGEMVFLRRRQTDGRLRHNRG